MIFIFTCHTILFILLAFIVFFLINVIKQNIYICLLSAIIFDFYVSKYIVIIVTRIHFYKKLITCYKSL